MKKVAIINSGGDVQGLNAVIHSIVTSGQDNYEFYGFIKGWEGLLDLYYISLTPEAVRGISHLGGTILKSTNKGRFAGKTGNGVVNQIPKEILEKAKSNLDVLGIEYLIAIGGDGTLSAAKQLSDYGVNVIGIPKTIDNDLLATDKTFGFSTAVSVVKDSLERIHTTATSHDRIFIVEVMGRDAGWIALYGGVAGGADGVIIPEVKFKYADIINFLKLRKSEGHLSSIIIVAEGAAPDGTEKVYEDLNTSEKNLGGVGEVIETYIRKNAGDEFETRSINLGHLVRGGSPSANDRILAKSYGVRALQALEDEDFGKVVCIQNNKMVMVDISETIEKTKNVTPDDFVYKTAKALGMIIGG